MSARSFADKLTPDQNEPDDIERIAAWLEGLSRHQACPAERRYWYEAVAADIRGGAWKNVARKL
jgi:hypothetical protein